VDELFYAVRRSWLLSGRVLGRIGHVASGGVEWAHTRPCWSETDGSDSSYRAVDRAAALARDAAAKLVIVCAYHAASEREVAAANEALGDEAYQVWARRRPRTRC